MSDIREQYLKETGEPIGDVYTFNCEHCDNPLIVDVWRDDYVVWLERKLENDKVETTSNCTMHDVVGSALPCTHPTDKLTDYHDDSVLCRTCNCIVSQHGEKIEPPTPL